MQNLNPKMLRWSWLLFLLLGFQSEASSPDFWKKKADHKLNNQYFSVGSGLGSMAYRDRVSSPRVFSGVSSGLHQGFEIVSQRRLLVLDGLAFFGAATDGAGWNGTSSTAITLNNNLAYLFYLPFEKSRLQWQVGPAAIMYGQIRINPDFGNATVGYDVMGALGARSRLELPFMVKSTQARQWWIFKWKETKSRPMRLGWEVDLPLLGFNARPPFVGVLDGVGNDPIATGFADFLNNTRGGVLGSFFYLNSRLYLQYPLRNGNRLQASYHWLGHSSTHLEQAVRSANSAMMFSYVFRFDANPDLR